MLELKMSWFLKIFGKIKLSVNAQHNLSKKLSHLVLEFIEYKTLLKNIIRFRKKENMNSTQTEIVVNDQTLDQTQIEEEIANDLWEEAKIKNLDRYLDDFKAKTDIKIITV